MKAGYPVTLPGLDLLAPRCVCGHRPSVHVQHTARLAGQSVVGVPVTVSRTYCWGLVLDETGDEFSDEPCPCDRLSLVYPHRG